MEGTLTVESFEPHCGTQFVIAADENVVLTLAVAEPLNRHRLTGPLVRAPFRLLFKGPLRPVLPQRIYRMDHQTLGRLEIFIVPLGPRDAKMDYEAIFS